MSRKPKTGAFLSKIQPGRLDWFCGAALAAAVLIAYARTWHAGFIWDDDDHLTANPCVVGPLGFKAIWTTSAAVYYPLVLTTFRVLHGLWGLNPLPYHVFNAAMHGACAVLLWRVLLRLRVTGAWLGAALWALHPVMVESVAWITELKNTQSCLFYLLSIRCFLKALPGELNRRAAWRDYGLALLFFLMAITSKSSTVMLPVVLALCTWWQEGSLRRGRMASLIPFFLVSAAAGMWTIREQMFHSGAQGADWTQTWPQRIIIAGREVWFYIVKLAWPHPLIFFYPRWEIDASRPAAYLPAFAAAVALVVLIWRCRHGKLRPLFFATAYFLVSLFPVLDFFHVYFFRYSFVADHFQYLAAIGPLALLGAGIATAANSLAPANRLAKLALRGVLPVVFGILSWRQSGNYSDNDTLYAATLEKNPRCWIACNNLGYDLLHQGEVDEAIGLYLRALDIMPGLAETRYNLGLALKEKGRAGEAIAQFQKAIELKPDYAQAHYDLGLALQENGEAGDAVTQYQLALAYSPGMADAHLNLGNIFGQAGQMDAAVAEFHAALAINPAYAKAHYNLGYAFQKGGQPAQAIAEYEKALGIQAGYPAALNALAYLLATCPEASLRDGEKALALAKQASEATGGNNPVVLDTLAAALAECGQFPDAVDAAQRALDLANSQSDATLAEQLRARIALYKSGKPFRDESLN